MPSASRSRSPAIGRVPATGNDVAVILGTIAGVLGAARAAAPSHALMHIQTDDVACSTCGSREADEVGRSRDYEFESCDNEFVFVCCRACGLTYLRNRPALDTLGIIYPPSYYRYAAFLGPSRRGCAASCRAHGCG